MGIKNIAYINREMLIWARSQTPFKDSADDIKMIYPKIDTDKIIRWENGEEFPSINEAKNICKIYRVPFACLYLSEPPQKDPPKYVDRRTYFETEHYKLSYELWSEINRVIHDREIALNYLEENVKHNIYDLSKLASENIDETANKIRSYLQMPTYYKSKFGQSFNYFRKLIENKNIIVTQISDVGLDEMKGLSISERILPIIAVNNRDFSNSKTFSLFHELAHIIRRSSSLCLIDDNERNDQEEKICDRIAAEVLMPKNEFIYMANKIFLKYNEWNTISLLALSKKFGVSTVSVFRRLHELKFFTDEYYYKEYKKINKDFKEMVDTQKKDLLEKKAPIRFPIRYINKHGRLMPRTVINAYDTGRISFGEVCKTLNVKRKHIDEITRMSAL